MSTKTTTTTGRRGAAARMAKAQAAAEKFRPQLMKWLELRKTMNSTNAARALGTHDMRMRHVAQRLGIEIPAISSKGPRAKAEQTKAFADFMAARKGGRP